MKNSTNHPVEHSSKRKVGKKAGAGSEGLATAPQQLSVAKTTPQLGRKLGLGPVSVATRAENHVEGIGAESTNGTSGRVNVTATSRSSVSVSDLKVSIVHGDDGDKYYLFQTPKGKIVRSVEVVIQNSLRVMADLRHLDIFATSPAIKAEIRTRIDAAKSDTEFVAATRVGYDQNPIPRYFVYGDGAVITASDDIQVVPLFDDPSRFERAGKHGAYEKGVAAVIRNQPIPITLFFFGLTPILKPFVTGTGYKAENMMFELVGRTSTYKSALACTLAGSAWGKGHSRDGYARSWNMTDQKIEELFADFNDHLLILDEVTAAHPNEKTRADRVLNTVHRLSSGQGRARTGQKSQSHSLSMLSTSNEPMQLILPATDEVRRALEVRLISLQLDADRDSFFESVPEGFVSVDAAMKQLFDVTGTNYGLLARRFILGTLKLVRKDEKKLRALLKQSMAEFIQGVGLDLDGVDELLRRRVQPFALAYATAVIAFETDTLKKKRWGNILESIRQAWIDNGDRASLFPGHPQLVAYMTNNSNIFVEARGKGKPNIIDKNFERVDGFFFIGKDKTLCLAVPRHAIKKLSLSAASLKKLKGDGTLRSGKNLQAKLELRRSGAQDKRDVFYVFRIDQIPPKTKILSDPKNE